MFGGCLVRKAKVILEAVIEKGQAFPCPTTVQQLQMFLGLFAHRRAFVLHLAQVCQPSYNMVKKGAKWDWDDPVEQSFLTAKCLIEEAQALQVVDPSRPFELDVRESPEGFGWGLWQRPECPTNPLGFGHRYGKKLSQDTPSPNNN